MLYNLPCHCKPKSPIDFTSLINSMKRISHFFRKHPIISIFLLLFFTGMLLSVGGVVGLYSAVYYGTFGELPTEHDLKAIKNPVASEVYSADGVLLGKYYIKNRTNVPYEQISNHILQALVATEDSRFFEHRGVDFQSLLRVLVKTLILGDKSAGGGSTLTQQVIKNIYGRPDYGRLTMPVSKIKEMIIASRLEKVYSKEEVIALYLNTVPFGEQAFGIHTACQRFFSKIPKNVSPTEAATLIGMLKAPTYYSPRRNPENALRRRNTVLGQMVKGGYISQAQANNLKQEPIELKYNRVTRSDGLAPHFRDKLKADLKAWAKENPQKNGDKHNIFTDGLKIYTTIDSRMQQYAQEAVKTHMTELQNQFYTHWEAKGKAPWYADPSILERAKQRTSRYKSMKKAGRSSLEIDRAFRKPMQMTVFTHEGEVTKTMTPMDSLKHYLQFLNTGFVVMNPKTGGIQASVGSVSHEYFEYDHTRSKRQVGSTFKPIVYATALTSGLHPCYFYKNELAKYVDHDGWTPKNADKNYAGYYSLKGALANSVNTVSAKIMLDNYVGVDRTIDMARKMGIHNDIPEYASIVLGTADLTVEEMVTAYATFANGGYAVKPYYITKITDGNGKLIQQFKNPNQLTEENRILRPGVAQAMVNILQDVVDEGTGRRLRFKYKLNNDMGGKTGTTQNQSDGWYMGFTPELVGGTWTGGANRNIRFESIRYGQGANMALPVWGEFLTRLQQDSIRFNNIVNAEFPQLSDSLFAELDCLHYSLYEPRQPQRVILADASIGGKKDTVWSTTLPEDAVPPPSTTPTTNDGGITAIPAPVPATRPVKPSETTASSTNNSGVTPSRPNRPNTIRPKPKTDPKPPVASTPSTPPPTPSSNTKRPGQVKGKTKVATTNGGRTTPKPKPSGGHTKVFVPKGAPPNKTTPPPPSTAPEPAPVPVKTPTVKKKRKKKKGLLKRIFGKKKDN